MQHSEFKIGDHFWTSGGKKWCTDIGTRTIIAIDIGDREVANPSWLHGPPYAVAEIVFDEYDFEDCYPTEEALQEDKHGG